MKRAGIFGMGAIGASLAADWQASPPSSWTLAGVCARPRQVAALRAMLAPETRVVDSIGELLALGPHAVVEAAGHAAAREVAGSVLRSGADLYLLSSGILADAEVMAGLTRDAEKGDATLVVPCGALAGFDGLAVVARLQPAEVVYRSTKPARAWRGTPAERDFDLAGMTAKTVIFRGSAREAALLFPRNANLAASVALAGVGFERTRVELVADPHATRNRAEVEVTVNSVQLKVELTSQAEARNPKSSAVVRTSVLAALERSSGRVRLG